MRYVCFLRAINVGGHTVTMAKLKSVFKSMGLERVETFIASGNVIFTSPKKRGVLERQISSCLKNELGYDVAAFLRTLPELCAIENSSPFESSRVEVAAAYNIAFTRSTLPEDDQHLRSFCSDIDVFAASGSEIYWLCNAKQSDSKFVSAALEKKIGSQVTWRGINTVRRIVAKYSDQK